MGPKHTQNRTPSCTLHATSLHEEHSLLLAENEYQGYCCIHFFRKVSVKHTNLTFIKIAGGQLQSGLFLLITSC